MRFCDECNSLLKPQKNNESNQTELFCKGCGETYLLKEEDKSFKKTSNIKIENIENLIITNKDEFASIVNMYCPKCENNKCYFFEMPPLFGDEENVIKYQCVKCNYTFRDGGKIT